MHKHNLLSWAIAALLLTTFNDVRADNEYMVEKGDSLYKIGELLGVPYQEIMKANGLKDSKIFPDQILRIPSAGKSSELDKNATLSQKTDQTAAEGSATIAKVERNVPSYWESQNPDNPNLKTAYIPQVQGKTRARPTVETKPAETYTVQAGDTVWSISRRFGVPADDLRKANQIKYSYIQVGQILKLPEGKSSVAIASN